MSVEKLYKAVKSGQIHPSKLNDEGKQALKQYITIKQGLPVAQAEPKPNLLQRAGEAVKSLIPSKETRDSISHTLFPAALSGKEGGLIENAIKNEQALRSRQNLGKGEAFLSGVRSGAMFGAGADEIRANNPQASGWVTGGEVLGSLIPSIGLYGGTLKAGQAATKLPGIGQALAKAGPLTKIGATGFVSEGAYGLGHGLLEGERGADLAKTTAMYGAIGGVADVTLTKVIGPAISKVLQRFKGKPVATETIERAVAKDIGVNWDNMNDTQRNAIKKVIQDMQGEAVSSGKTLNVGQEFTMRDVTPQDRLKQVLPEGPLALPQPKQNFTLEPEPFKKQIPKVDFEKPRPIQTPQPKTETFYPPQDDFPLYHGTWRKHKGFEDGRDFYFTDNKEFAKSFIREPREGTDLGGELLGGRLKPSAKVLDTRTPEGKKIADEIIKADEVMSYNGVESFKRDSFRDGLPIYSKDNFIKAAKEKGYDAIVLSERDGITSHRIFNKKAIDVKTINDKTPLTFEINKRPGTPIEARDFENVGDRSIKAISFENPQIRPYYQYEAQNLLGEMQYAVPGKRTVAYNEFDEMVFTGQKKSVSDSIETIQAITGASYKEIEKGLQDIIHDKGRENNALSKRIELIIDENLSSGYKAFDGRPIPPNQDYLKAKENLYVQPKLREPLRLNAGQNFGMSEPIYRKQVPREFDKTPIPTELPDYVTNDPLRFKRTMEVPARKLQPDLTPPLIKATKQPDLMPPKIEKKIIEPVLKATQKVDEGTLFNVKEMKDISGFQGYATDVYRNFKQAFGKNYDKVKKTILDPFDASKKQNADFQKTWVERLNKEVVEGLGIKKGSKLSELVQKFGEGTLSEVEFNSIKPDDLKKIQQADAWFRKAYNELIDQVNAVRRRIYPNSPDKIIPKRKDYYRHFQEISNDIQGLKNIFATPAQIDPNLEGISEFTKPKAAWKSWAQRRTGAGEFKNDAVGGFLNYLPSASYGIHIDPHISVFAKLARDLSKASKDTKNINNFIRFLNRYSQDLAGKTNPVDRIAQEVTGRKFFRAVDWLNRRVKANVILGNVGSALSQLGNVPQGIAYAKQYSVPGIQRTIRSIFQPNEAIQKSGFISERYLDKIYRQFDTDLLSKPRNLAVWMMEKSDEIGTHIIWNSAYEKAVAEGVENAVKQADDITRSLVAGRGIGEVPIGQKSKIIQTLMPFTLEVANLWKVQKDMLAKKDIVGLLMLYGSAYGYNEIMEKTRGTRIVFDPIDALIDAFEEDLTPLERGGRIAGEVIGNIPMGQFLGSMYPEYGTSIGGLDLPTRKQLFGRNDPTRFGTGLLVQKGLQDPLYKVAMPFGGAQLQKTIKGLDAINSQGVYGNKEKTKLKYPVSDDITNTIKGALFGVGALNETRPYYDQDRRPLSENQTLEIDSLKGEARKDAYEYLMLQRKYNSLVDKWKKETDPAEKLKLFLQIERLQKGEG